MARKLRPEERELWKNWYEITIHTASEPGTGRGEACACDGCKILWEVDPR